MTSRECDSPDMIVAYECSMPLDWHRARIAYREERSIEQRCGYSTVDVGGEGGSGGGEGG